MIAQAPAFGWLQPDNDLKLNRVSYIYGIKPCIEQVNHEGDIGIESSLICDIF